MTDITPSQWPLPVSEGVLWETKVNRFIKQVFFPQRSICCCGRENSLSAQWYLVFFCFFFILLNPFGEKMKVKFCVTPSHLFLYCILDPLRGNNFKVHQSHLNKRNEAECRKERSVTSHRYSMKTKCPATSRPSGGSGVLLKESEF